MTLSATVAARRLRRDATGITDHPHPIHPVQRAQVYFELSNLPFGLSPRAAAMHRAPIGGDIAIDEGIADPLRLDEGAAQLRGDLRDDLDAAPPAPYPQRKIVADAFDHHLAQADILRGQVGFDADVLERLKLIVNLDDVRFVKAVAPALVVAQRAGENGVGIAKKRLAVGGKDLEKLQRGAVGGEVDLDFARRYHAPQIDFDPPILDAVIRIGSPIGRQVSIDEMAGVAGVGAYFADAAAGKV